MRVLLGSSSGGRIAGLACGAGLRAAGLAGGGSPRVARLAGSRCLRVTRRGSGAGLRAAGLAGGGSLWVARVGGGGGGLRRRLGGSRLARVAAARLKGLEVLGDVEAQTRSATAVLRSITLTRNVAVGIGDLGSVIGEDDTAPTLLTVLGTSKGETHLLAGGETGLGGEGRGIEVNGIRQSATLLRVIGVAAKRLVVVDGNVIGALGEGGILPDGKSVVSTASLRLVTCAGQGALRVVNLSTVDG